MKSHDKYESLRTCGIPKPLYPICGKPLLYYCLQNLAEQSVSRAIIVTWSADKEQVQATIASFDFGSMKVEFVISTDNSEYSSQISGLSLALPFIPIDSTFSVVFGDMTSPLTLPKLPGNTSVSMTLTSSNGASPFIVGVSDFETLALLKPVEEIEFDGELRLTASSPLKIRGDLFDANVYTFKNTETFKSAIEENTDEETISGLIGSRMVNTGTVSCVISPSPTIRVKSLADLLAAHQAQARVLKLKGNNWSESVEPEGVVLKNSAIGKSVQIGIGSRIVRSVVMDNVVIAPGSTIEDSLICPGARVTGEVSSEVVVLMNGDN